MSRPHMCRDIKLIADLLHDVIAAAVVGAIVRGAGRNNRISLVFSRQHTYIFVEQLRLRLPFPRCHDLDVREGAVQLTEAAQITIHCEFFAVAVAAPERCHRARVDRWLADAVGRLRWDAFFLHVDDVAVTDAVGS